MVLKFLVLVVVLRAPCTGARPGDRSASLKPAIKSLLQEGADSVLSSGARAALQRFEAELASNSTLVSEIWDGDDSLDGYHHAELLEQANVLQGMESQGDSARSRVKVHVFGLQDSGTNLLFSMLLLNFAGQITLFDVAYSPNATGPQFRHGIWKHSNIAMKAKREPQVMQSLIKEGVVPLIMVRDPLSWLQSIKKAPYELKRCVNKGDEWLRATCRHPFPGGYASLPAAEYSSLPEVWNNWTQAYAISEDLGFARPVVTRYEDLVSEPVKTMASIASQLGLRAPANWKVIQASAKNHGASHGRAEALEKIQKKTYLELYEDRDHRRACHRLERDLLQKLSYLDCGDEAHVSKAGSSAGSGRLSAFGQKKPRRRAPHRRGAAAADTDVATKGLGSRIFDWIHIPSWLTGSGRAKQDLVQGFHSGIEGAVVTQNDAGVEHALAIAGHTPMSEQGDTPEARHNFLDKPAVDAAATAETSSEPRNGVSETSTAEGELVVENASASAPPRDRSFSRKQDATNTKPRASSALRHATEEDTAGIPTTRNQLRNSEPSKNATYPHRPRSPRLRAEKKAASNRTPGTARTSFTNSSRKRIPVTTGMEDEQSDVAKTMEVASPASAGSRKKKRTHKSMTKSQQFASSSKTTEHHSASMSSDQSRLSLKRKRRPRSGTSRGRDSSKAFVRRSKSTPRYSLYRISEPTSKASRQSRRSLKRDRRSMSGTGKTHDEKLQADADLIEEAARQLRKDARYKKAQLFEDAARDLRNEKRPPEAHLLRTAARGLHKEALAKEAAARGHASAHKHRAHDS